jgi:hypothetical protein
MTDEPKPSIAPLTRFMRATFHVRNVIKNSNILDSDKLMTDDLIKCVNELAQGVSRIRNKMIVGDINFKEAQDLMDTLLENVATSVKVPEPVIDTNWEKNKNFPNRHPYEYDRKNSYKPSVQKEILRLTEEISRILTEWAKRFDSYKDHS